MAGISSVTSGCGHTIPQVHTSYLGSAGYISPPKIPFVAASAIAASPSADDESLVTRTLASMRTSATLSADLHTIFGAHVEADGVTFRAAAPDAVKVELVLKDNGKDVCIYEMSPFAEGAWQVQIKGLKEGTRYQYLITTKSGAVYRKSDPFALKKQKLDDPFFQFESIVDKINHELWTDTGWMTHRDVLQGKDSPLSLYKVHPLYWKKGKYLNLLYYVSLGELLTEYCKKNGFTHVLLEDLLEGINPLESSLPWSLFIPRGVLGTIQELQIMIDLLHNNSIGVLMRMPLDRFDAGDRCGLCYFDGSPLFHKDKDSTGKFDLRSSFVRNFLASAVQFWSEMHIDGFVIDTDRIVITKEPLESVERTPYGGFAYPSGIKFLEDLLAYMHEKHKGILLLSEGDVPVPSCDFDYIKTVDATARPDKTIRTLTHPPKDASSMLNLYRMNLCKMFFLPGIKSIDMGEELGQKDSWRDRLVLAHTNIFKAAVDWEASLVEPHSSITKLTEELNKFYFRHPSLHPTAEVHHHATALGLECFERVDAAKTESLLCFCNTCSAVHRLSLEASTPLEGYELCFTSNGDDTFVPMIAERDSLGTIAPYCMLVFRRALA